MSGLSGRSMKTNFFVRYYEKEIEYTRAEWGDLQLAYASTVHKSQGSEYDTIIFALLPEQRIMLQRNLLYTGITRARKKTILVTTKAHFPRQSARHARSIDTACFCLDQRDEP